MCTAVSKGIKTSEFKDHDQTEKVINKLLSTLFGDEQRKGSNLWKKIRTIIFKTQPKTPVDKGGTKTETINPVISTDEELAKSCTFTLFSQLLYSQKSHIFFQRSSY